MSSETNALSNHVRERMRRLLPNLSLVAWRDCPKPCPVVRLIDEVQEKLASQPGSLFRPYQLEQIHSTLIGMEGVRVGDKLLNLNFAANFGREVAMEFESLQSCVRSLPDPIRIRYGGFLPCTCNDQERRAWICQQGGTFHCCGASAYDESVYAFPKDKAVITGWPVDSTLEFTREAYHFRIQCGEHAGVADKFHFGGNHTKWYFANDDCGMSVGEVNETPADSLAEAVGRARSLLGAPNAPLYADLRHEDLAFVKYRDFGLADVAGVLPLRQATASELAGLYEDVGWQS